MIFEMIADVTFEAENMDDMLLVLSEYFGKLGNDEQGTDLLFTTDEIIIKPAK